MFWLFKNKKETTIKDSNDQWMYTEKEAEENELILFKNDMDSESVVVSVDRKRLYRLNSIRWDDFSVHIQRIYEYMISWEKVYIKEIQDSSSYIIPKKSKEYRIKNWEVDVDWIYKEYNNPAYPKEKTLEELIDSYKKLCEFHDLDNMRVKMYILSKNLNKAELILRTNKIIESMNEWRKKYYAIISWIWVTEDDSLDEIIKKFKEHWEDYNKLCAAIQIVSWCSIDELTSKFDETVELIKSYTK